jgi:hypothetical protein
MIADCLGGLNGARIGEGDQFVICAEISASGLSSQ